MFISIASNEYEFIFSETSCGEERKIMRNIFEEIFVKKIQFTFKFLIFFNH